VRVTGAGHEALIAGNPLPRHTIEELGKAGVEVRGAPLPADTRAVLLRLDTPERPADFRIGLHNFYVLTRYNRSVFYALSVADLAERLRAARGKARAVPPPR
jgi:membrane-bound lytic murein transglycosylase B